MAPQHATCPHCRTPMAWSHVNQQWYCNRCEIFIQSNAPRTTFDNIQRELDEEKKQKIQNPTCLVCGKPLSYIPQYQRWYCYPCRKYV